MDGCNRSLPRISRSDTAGEASDPRNSGCSWLSRGRADERKSVPSAKEVYHGPAGDLPREARSPTQGVGYQDRRIEDQSGAGNDRTQPEVSRADRRITA